MNDDQAFDPEAILAAFNGHGVEYVVVGGLAVAAHGVVRATADLDVVGDHATLPTSDHRNSLGSLTACA